METLAFSHLAFNEEDSADKEFTVCVDFTKLSSVGMMGLLSTATVVGAMGVTADSASAYYGGGYGNSNSSYGGSRSYGRSYGSYYKKVKVIRRTYGRTYGRSNRYGRSGRRYGSYGGGGYGGGGYGGGGDCYDY
ncbi:MAG: hypothetical protein WBA93_14345 [Microcoleaceae cyanobacterium]